jgi:hypothetical protein
MFDSNDAPPPVADQPMPVFAPVITLLLKNMQEITPPQECMPRHDNQKGGHQKFKKKQIPIQCIGK